MKKYFVIFFSFVLAGAIVFGWSALFPEDTTKLDTTTISSLIEQKVLEYDKETNSYYKIYNAGDLIGIISDYDYIQTRIDEEYIHYEEDFPNTELGFGEDVYIVPESSFAVVENIDDKIVDYLVENGLLGVKTHAIEFSTDEGVYSIIYVKNLDDFYEARDEFLMNFISSENLTRLENGEKIESPSDYGTIETNIQIVETMSEKEAIVSPDKILKDVSEIYNYLCYGDNEERTYYTTKEGDTLQGVGYYYGDMTTKQLVMLNPDVLMSEKQIITPGMQLNVTYYTSPLTVVVTKENLSQQLIYADTPTYVQDETLTAGEAKIVVQEESGMKNVLYEETWINGVLQSGTLKSETITKQAVQGVIAIGTMGTRLSGTSNLIWPVDNPYITCHWGCYLNHTGTDFINKYNSYGNVYASDTGLVIAKGYSWDMGYYIMLDHENGIKTYYMHLNVPAYPEIGEYVNRGDTIGQIGSTGISTGPHLHFVVVKDNERVNSCYYLPCSLLEDY